MNKKLIIVTHPLREGEIPSFVSAFKDLFKPIIIPSGMYDTNGTGRRYPKYYVCREAKNGEYIAGYEFEI